MEYTIYQLEFKTGVHFGTGMLNESACTFKGRSDIFSTLYRGFKTESAAAVI